MTVIIREAHLADGPALVLLNEEIQRLHVAHRPETFRSTRTVEVARRFDELLGDPAVKIWLAVVDQELAGYLVGVVRSQAETAFTVARTWFELDQIGVQPRHWRGGVARQLVARAVAYATSNGIERVELCSWSFNQQAQRAFERLGFVPKVVRFELGPFQGK